MASDARQVISDDFMKKLEVMGAEGAWPLIRDYVLAAEAAAIEECADATSQDCQVIVTSLGNMQDGDATGEDLDRAMKAALHLPKRVRSLLTPARKSALEAKMLEAYNKGLSDGVATIQSDCSDALKRCNDELASLRKENGNG